MYKSRNKIPETGQLCLCKCPNWCSLGLQVAEWTGKKFDYPEVPNDEFDSLVEQWMPLNYDGEPE
jgi:hypothetical protein